MQFLRANTAATLKMGPVVDETDGVTPVTSLSGTVVYLSKNGGSFSARSSNTAISHDRDGYFDVPLNGTDTATFGRGEAQFTNASAHLPVREKFIVLPQPIYDWFFGTDVLQVDVATHAPSAIDVNTFTTAALNAVATQVLTTAESLPIAADIKQVNNVTVQGVGTSGDPWRPV